MLRDESEKNKTLEDRLADLEMRLEESERSLQLTQTELEGERQQRLAAEQVSSELGEELLTKCRALDAARDDLSRMVRFC